MFFGQSSFKLALINKDAGFGIVPSNKRFPVWSKTMRLLILKPGKLGVAHFKKRGNLKADSVTVATLSVNLTWSSSVCVSLSPPPVSFHHALSQSYGSVLHSLGKKYELFLPE